MERTRATRNHTTLQAALDLDLAVVLRGTTVMHIKRLLAQKRHTGWVWLGKERGIGIHVGLPSLLRDRCASYQNIGKLCP